MEDWRRTRKIAQMPGVERTPVNTLAATLEKATAGHVKSVYIGIEWTDGTFCGDWSRMPRKDIAVHALVAQQNALSEFEQGGEVV
jgi:delta-aminolevulinic acid dehydratase/porphobilinogen synthase